MKTASTKGAAVYFFYYLKYLNMNAEKGGKCAKNKYHF